MNNIYFKAINKHRQSGIATLLLVTLIGITIMLASTAVVLMSTARKDVSSASHAQSNAQVMAWAGVSAFNFRYSHDFVLRIGSSKNTLQLNFDFMNIGNLFNSTWGVHQILSTEAMSGRILQLDSINEQGVPVFKTRVQAGARTWDYSHSMGQCWSLQVGIKYLFN